MELENWIRYGGVLGLPLWLVAEEVLHWMGPTLTTLKRTNRPRGAKASRASLAASSIRPAER